MQQLLSQLGIDWRLLIAQAVNFFVLLVVLLLYVYQPLLKLMRERGQRIEDGVMKADEADRRLLEIEEIGKEKIKAAEHEALGVIKKAEADGKTLEARLLAEARQKEEAALKNTEALLRAREEESRRALEKEAASFVRRAIAKTVDLAPETIDNALIAKAVEEAKQTA